MRAVQVLGQSQAGKCQALIYMNPSGQRDNTGSVMLAEKVRQQHNCSEMDVLHECQRHLVYLHVSTLLQGIHLPLQSLAAHLLSSKLFQGLAHLLQVAEPGTQTSPFLLTEVLHRKMGKLIVTMQD